MDQTRACSKSSRAALAWTKKKRSLRNEKLKTGENGRWQTAQVGHGDRKRKTNKTGE